MSIKERVTSIVTGDRMREKFEGNGEQPIEKAVIEVLYPQRIKRKKTRK